MNDSPIDIVLLISRWLHLSAAIVTLGGAFFARFALSRAAGRVLSEATHTQLRDAVRAAWAPFLYASIAVLLATGGYNFMVMALPPKIEPIPYHPIFGVKFLAALLIFFIASVLAGGGRGFQNMRARRSRWLTILLLCGGLVVLLSGVLNQVRTGQIGRARSGAAAAEAMPARQGPS